METAIIDYGMGNLLSVQRAFEKCGSDAVIIDNPLERGMQSVLYFLELAHFRMLWTISGKNGWIEELKPGGFGKRDTDSWNLPWNAAPCGQGL